MSEMTDFERRLSDGFQGLMGPSEPVDDGAIFAVAISQSPPKWRFQSMFSATKFVFAGAIVALFGGFLLAGVLPSEPTEPQPPAAATESAQPASSTTGPASEFTGRVNYRGTSPAGDRHEYRVWEMSDPRLEGDWVQATTDTTIPLESGPAARVWHASFRVENEEGAWQEVPNLGLVYPDETSSTRTSLRIGEGAYEGLTAIVEFSRGAGERHFLEHGVISSRAMPPPPSHADTDA